MKNKFTIVAITLNILIFNMLLLTSCDESENNLTSNESYSIENSEVNVLPQLADIDTPEPSDTDENSNNSETSDTIDDVNLEDLADEQIEIENTEIELELVEMENFPFTDIDQLENVGKGWGQGLQVDEFNRPISCDIFQEKYIEHEAYFIMPNVGGEQKIYLTFDQGYENGYTSMILDALLEKDAPAVFFLTLPYTKSNPDLVQRMIDEGHVLGNHSVSHLSTPTLTPQKQAEEILELHNYIIEEYNYEMDLFRPPMGEWSTQSLEITKQLGYKTIFWSYAYRDWEVDNQMGVEAAFPLVTNAAHNGGLYLLHSVSSDNAHMLGDVIDKLRDDGYEFCDLDFDKIVFATDDETLEVAVELDSENLEELEEETEEEELEDVAYIINTTNKGV